jgi:dolichyl-phosphate beta-glucosyltransferase
MTPTPGEPCPVRYSVVLPAYNEAALIAGVLDELARGMRRRGEPFELLVVENGSTDGTAAVLAGLEGVIPELSSVSLAEADYGRAIAKGFQLAAAPIVVHFDVDYYDLGFLEDAVRLIDDGAAGIVLASKRAPGADDRRPLQRRLLTAGFTLAMRALLQTSITDAHGMKVLSRAQCASAAASCQMTGALYDIELVLRASAAGVRVVELPATVSELRPPRTPVWRRGVQSGLGLVQLRILLRRERRSLRRRAGSSAATAVPSRQHARQSAR